MTHIHPGTDTTVNPVIINDTHRERQHSSEQPKHTDDLFLITREELDRCCSQMSAAGYKVSANYVEASVLSRPHQCRNTSEAIEMKQITSQFKGYTMYIDNKGNLVVSGVGKFSNFVALFYLNDVRGLVKEAVTP